jgi:hypothetical protein
MLASCGGDDDNGTDPDTTPPTVVSVTPEDAEVDVSAASTITVTFSEAVNPATVNSSSFQVNNGAVGDFSCNGNTATFTPVVNLIEGADYTVTITTDVRDLAGNQLQEPYTWAFKTVWSLTPPVVLMTTPANNGTDFRVNLPITIMFSKVMDPATINSSAFIMGGGVTGTVDYSENIMIFTPDDYLDFNTAYNAGVTTDVRDSSQTAMAANHFWSFTTGEERIVDGIEYFPMANGDTWYYYDSSSSQQIIRMVDGDTVVNGVTCKKILENGVTSEAWTVDSTEFLAHMLGEIYWFVPPLAIPLDMVLEETHTYNSDVFWVISDTLFQGEVSGRMKFKGHFADTVPAGQFDDVIKFLYLDGGYSEYYARGVGLLDNGDYVLDSAVIGGVKYPPGP